MTVADSDHDRICSLTYSNPLASHSNASLRSCPPPSLPPPSLPPPSLPPPSLPPPSFHTISYDDRVGVGAFRFRPGRFVSRPVGDASGSSRRSEDSRQSDFILADTDDVEVEAVFTASLVPRGRKPTKPVDVTSAWTTPNCRTPGGALTIPGTLRSVSAPLPSVRKRLSCRSSREARGRAPPRPRWMRGRRRFHRVAARPSAPA